jgi:poly(3-hydroxybutyrate) depolymerase
MVWSPRLSLSSLIARVARAALAWRTRLPLWLSLRLGLLRGRWRRGGVSVPQAMVLPMIMLPGRWSYGLYAPAALHDDDAAPLLLLLHGCGQRALNFAQASGWQRWAETQRARLLCPDQRRRANPHRCWNWFMPQEQWGGGELLAVLAALDDAAARVNVAAGSVRVVGLSAGGALAALLAFHHASRFAAVAVVGAPPLLGVPSFQDPRDVLRRGLANEATLALDLRLRDCAPLAVIHGADDAIVSRRCAEQLAEQALATHRRADRVLQAQPPRIDAGNSCVDHRADGRLWLREVSVSGLGHGWTGGPGGHAYCERGGPALISACSDFFADTATILPTQDEPQAVSLA